ncbi:MAG: glycogen synthase GlgA [Candidatus Izemoplasma sp.]
MKILFVGSEAVPFSKTGGLADVLGALPKELVKKGIDARVILPKHGVTKNKYDQEMTKIVDFYVNVGSKKEYVGIEFIKLDGVTYYFVDNEYYFGFRDTLYGHYDDGERYGFFSNAVLKSLELIDFIPDIINVADWPTGLIPYLYNKKFKHRPAYKNIKTMFTIHNIAYQGIFPKDLLVHLDVEFGNELEHDGMINFLKCGISSADYISTVSQTYANEILYDYFSFGMSEILRSRQDDLYGIINGLDYDKFSPDVDNHIVYNYSTRNYLKGKKTNKEALMNYFGLTNPKLPLIGIVSRLTTQKGFDLIEEAIEGILQRKDAQFAILGSGDSNIEQYFNYLKERFPNSMGVYIGYSEEMANKIYAGSDLFLMPSRFEPCGLAQLISLKYGTLPIVRKTGGLKDTIKPYNKFTKEGTGFSFETYDSCDMLEAFNQAIEVYKDKPTWNKLVKNAMNEDFSWEMSAGKYIDLFKKLMEE